MAYTKKHWWSAGLVLVLVIAATGCATTTDTTSQGSKGAKSGKKAKEEAGMTSSQKRAVQSAENYLELSGFSKAGLIQQLSSSAGDGFSKADARFAANHVDADWKQEAVESAKNYLEISPMSKDALIQQLTSSAGDKYTQAQARYAAEKVY